MFKVAFDNKDKTDKTIYIKHSYSVKGVKKQMIIEKYPSANELVQNMVLGNLLLMKESKF